MPLPPSKNGHSDLLARKLKRSLCLQDYPVNATRGAVVSKRWIGGTGWRPPLRKKWHNLSLLKGLKFQLSPRLRECSVPDKKSLGSKCAKPVQGA
eukprot:185133-Rhodomonas_salina.1